MRQVGLATVAIRWVACAVAVLGAALVVPSIDRFVRMPASERAEEAA